MHNNNSTHNNIYSQFVFDSERSRILPSDLTMMFFFTFENFVLCKKLSLFRITILIENYFGWQFIPNVLSCL